LPKIQELNSFGEDLERILRLRTSPIAVKMLKNEADIPEGAIRPNRDRGCHLAQCQAFAMSRRQKATVAMLKDDQWCWAPLVAYGHVDPSMADDLPAISGEAKKMPKLECGKYIGIVSAPLRTANFEPDLVLIYSNNAQLRYMLMSLSYGVDFQVVSPFNPIGSCAYSVAPALEGKFAITLPDPGEFDRALAAEDEIIFSVPGDKIGHLVSRLKTLEERRAGYIDSFMEMKPDFPRPDFYKKLFKKCGLEAD
jgi:uncharacterized protein (DUF169 family)